MTQSLKFTISFIFISIVLSCNNQNDSNKNINKTNEIKIEKKAKEDTLVKNTQTKISNKIECDYSEKFDLLKKNIELNDKEKISNYFNFPFSDNNIWYLISLNKQSEDYKSDSDFNKEDLAKHLESIFPKNFTTLLSNVETNIFFNTGVFETNKIKIKEGSHKLRTIFNDSSKELVLSLYSEYNDSGEIFQTMINYVFQYDEKCNLKLKNIHIAG